MELSAAAPVSPREEASLLARCYEYILSWTVPDSTDAQTTQAHENSLQDNASILNTPPTSAISGRPMMVDAESDKTVELRNGLI